MGAFRDLTGQIFGRLTVLRCVGRDKHRNALWLCRCECGKEVEVVRASLVRELTQSCGCLRQEVTSAQFSKHGRSHKSDPTYSSWRNLQNRIMQPNNSEYRYYGGAGVRIDPRWLGEHGFENFLADMGKRPEGTTLGRFRDIGDYAPENCAWQTRKEQAAEQKVKRQLALLVAWR